jgi:hypothetical protein
MAFTGTITQCGSHAGRIKSDDGSELRFEILLCWGYPKLGARVEFEKTTGGFNAVNVRVLQ